MGPLAVAVCVSFSLRMCLRGAKTPIFLWLAPIGARRTGILVGEPPPQYTVMPSSINDVRCAPMSAFLLQDPAPWIALQSMDGSGELSY